MSSVLDTQDYNQLKSAIGNKAAGTVQRGLNWPAFYGKTFYVCNQTGYNGSDSNSGLSPRLPLATIDAAIGKCTASRGDRILVMPGHAETLSAAGAITADVAGISIIGVGNGSNRPTLTFGDTAATILVSAANVLFHNVRLTVSVDEVVKLFNVTGAAHLTLDRVDFFETASAQARQFLLCDATSDDLTIRNCRHVQNAAAGAAQAWISLVGCDRFRIEDNIFVLTLNDAAGSAVVKCATTACHDGVIARNLVRMTGFSSGLVSAFLDSASSRILVADNRIGTDVAANTTINDCPSGWSFNNLCTNAVDKSGIVDPVVDT